VKDRMTIVNPKTGKPEFLIDERNDVADLVKDRKPKPEDEDEDDKVKKEQRDAR
jgi:hypothetical protein